jgi:hypothetical protein
MLSMVLFGSVVAVTGAVGCVGMDELSSESSGELGKKAAAPKLNLSHIVCDENGGVTAHFVLLFAGDGQPGTLSGTLFGGGTFEDQEADKNTGNVWHYNVTLDSGYIEILTAQTTTSDGKVVSLHNPSDYSGTYACGEEQEEVCSIVVEPQDVYCTDKPLKNPGSECGHFGLEYTGGKIDGLSGLEYTALQDAYVAIVKSGNHGCGPGNSAYRIYVGVEAGDKLATPVDQGISHVTYCDCPASAPQ